MIDPGAGWIPRPWSIPMRPAAAASIARHCLRAIPASFIATDTRSYKQLADPQRDGGPATLAFCWTHWRRGFVEIEEGGPAPIAHEALERIAALYAIENRIRGPQVPMNAALSVRRRPGRSSRR